MRIYLLTLTALLAFSPLVRAEITGLSAAQRRLLQQPVELELLRTTERLPAAVLGACASLTHDTEFRLANPGRPWQATDSLPRFGLQDLPRRRLHWAARIPGYYVLHYELGGRGHNEHVLLVATGGERQASTHVVWAAVCVDAFRDYAGFVAGLRAGKLDDRFEYGH